MKFHWAAVGTLVSATNSKAESQKIKQNHAAPPFSAGTGADPKRAFSIQEEDSPLDEKTAQIQQKQTLSIRGSISWSSGKYGLLRNAPVHRSHQVQAVGAPCDPSNKSNDADVGILGCDPGFVCQENPSRDGDYYCVADNALHSSRKLDDVFEGDCDYSDYNEGTGLGTVVCTYPDVCGEYGLPENTCARLIVTSTFDNPDDVYDYDAEACYNLFEGEYDADGDIVKMCYVPDGDSCSTSVNGEKCKTCTINEIDDGGNRTDYGGSGSTCIITDCSNTCAEDTFDLCATEDYFSPALSCFGGGGDGAIGSFHGTTLSSSLALAGVAAGAFAAWF